MAGGFLYGWYDAGGKWVKIACNAAGKLLSDVSAFFENPPTEGETGKGPSSDWAFDHAADTAAHHAKYTDVEARAAIGDLLSSIGVMQKNLNANFYDVLYLRNFTFKSAQAHAYQITMSSYGASRHMRFLSYQVGVGYVTFDILKYNGSVNVLVIDQDNFQAELDNYLEAAPSDGVTDKAPQSAWAYTHENNAGAHHEKYTDSEAREACKLDGTLYWSCPGIHFDALYPDVNDITKHNTGVLGVEADGIALVAAVDLPNGATITGVVVYGDAAAEAETFTLARSQLSAFGVDTIGTANIGTEDTTLSNNVVDNSTYSYYIYTSSLDTDDTVYGARISYTL